MNYRNNRRTPNKFPSYKAAKITKISIELDGNVVLKDSVGSEEEEFKREIVYSQLSK